MAKSKKCTAILNTSYGYCATPQKFESINKAVAYCRESGFFAYRIFDEEGRQIRQGFCK